MQASLMGYSDQRYPVSSFSWVEIGGRVMKIELRSLDFTHDQAVQMVWATFMHTGGPSWEEHTRFTCSRLVNWTRKCDTSEVAKFGMERFYIYQQWPLNSSLVMLLTRSLPILFNPISFKVSHHRSTRGPGKQCSGFIQLFIWFD